MTRCRPTENFVDAVRERREKYGIYPGFFTYFLDAHTRSVPVEGLDETITEFWYSDC